ncbi:MAG: lipase family protein [Chthoniobacteraceae bacterium]
MIYTFPANFDKEIAKQLGGLIDNAYEQLKASHKIEDWKKPEGYDTFAVFGAKEPFGIGKFTVPDVFNVLPTLPFGFVLSKGNDVFIIIRGTQTQLEWVDDFTFQPTPFIEGKPEWGKTTQGFKSLYDQIFPGISTALDQLKASGNPLSNIYITGHSLGAALAHLVATGLYATKALNSTSYTFSGPRTGDSAFATSYQTAALATWRIFNTEDIVPDVPPATVQMDEPPADLKHLLSHADPLRLILRLFPYGYQHIGYPIAITFHGGTVGDNHNLTTTYKAL